MKNIYEEILFVELSTKKTFTVPSWEYVKENGGLRNIITSLGFNYDDCYNEAAIFEPEQKKPLDNGDPKRREAQMFFMNFRKIKREENKKRRKQWKPIR